MTTPRDAARIRELKAEIRHLRALVEAQLKRGGTLDRAAASGNIGRANRLLDELKKLEANHNQRGMK